MLAKLSSYTLVGIDAVPVEVEVDVSAASMPKTVLVGLAEAAVRENMLRPDPRYFAAILAVQQRIPRWGDSA